MKETKFDGISYVCPTWDEMGEMSFRLSKKIIESKNEFDSVVALAKGGWTWARTTVDNLAIENLFSIRVKSYNGVNSNGKVELKQPLVESVNGKKVLIYDDVADSGETLKFTKDYIIASGAKEVMTATLCSKPRSSIIPDFYGFETEAWVVFPHEKREFIEGSCSNWSSNGIKNGEMRSRFKKIGLPMNQVDYFMSRAGFEIK
jgi:hypoxanthine phosphoribosyltransferase